VEEETDRGSTLAERVRDARTLRGWTREELAVRANISWSAIAQIESGRRQNVRPDTLRALAQALRITIDYLVQGSVDTPVMLEHRASIYSGADGFMKGAAGFVAQAVERDESTLVAMTDDNLGLAREIVGGDAANVEFVRSEDAYVEPAALFTTFLRFVHDGVARGHGWTRIVSEPPWPRSAGTKARDWRRFESLLNLTFTALPVSILCLYDEGRLPKSMTEQARATHAEVVIDGTPQPSDDYGDPASFVLCCD
jgi:transcriptional regulator with XRE-family HTH domain